MSGGNGSETTGVLEHLGPILALDDLSGASSSPSGIKRMLREERLHAAGEFRAWCLEQKMEVNA
jgi:hypothetical protein